MVRPSRARTVTAMNSAMAAATAVTAVTVVLTATIVVK